jgi:hypothetical protein
MHKLHQHLCYLPDAAIKQKDAGLKTRSSSRSLGMWMDVPEFFYRCAEIRPLLNAAAVNAIKVEWPVGKSENCARAFVLNPHV